MIVRVHQKGHGPAVPSSRGDSCNVCTASEDDIDSETPAVNAVRRQEQNHRQHMAVLLERVHEIRLNQQRHRGLASWAESPRVWEVPASSVPPDPSSSPRGLRISLQIRLVSEEKLRRIQKKGSETSKPRSSTSGMSSTLVPVVQENY